MRLLLNKKKEKCPTTFGRIVQFCTMRFFFYRWIKLRGAISGETGGNRVARREEVSSSPLPRNGQSRLLRGE